MKTKLLLLHFFLYGMLLQAQVTIGSGLSSNLGSILDLKEKTTAGGESNSSRGFLLPRVLLNTAPDLAPTVTGATAAQKTMHTGLTVYHIGNVNLCAGVYIWDATRWNRLPKECKINLMCETGKAHGTYIKGTPLNASNIIKIKIDVPYSSKDGTYLIYTDTQNGMQFSASGNLAAGIMDITLNGMGTPVLGNVTSDFTISANFSNSTSSPECTVSITPDMYPTRILNITTVGANGVYGWHAHNSGAAAMYKSALNFGTNANSVVKSSGFNVTTFYKDNLFDYDVVTPAGGINSADIFINGYSCHIEEAYPASKAVTDALVNKLNSGGVLILMDEYKGNYNIALNVLKRLFPANAGSMQALASNPSGAVLTISSSVPANDPILDGPFSVTNWASKNPLNLRGKLWGNDASDAVEISGLPLSELIVYSTGKHGNPTMFRLKNYNLFFVGDGGFVSNANTFIGNSYTGGANCPFAIDSNHQPISHIKFGSTPLNTVYNSQIFANVMAWAVKLRSN